MDDFWKLDYYRFLSSIALMMAWGGCKGFAFRGFSNPGWGFGDEGLAEAEHLIIRLLAWMTFWKLDYYRFLLSIALMVAWGGYKGSIL